jgi:hypothetical protein
MERRNETMATQRPLAPTPTAVLKRVCDTSGIALWVRTPKRGRYMIVRLDGSFIDSGEIGQDKIKALVRQHGVKDNAGHYSFLSFDTLKVANAVFDAYDALTG